MKKCGTRIASCIMFLGLVPVCLSGQELRLEDIPPTGMSPNSVRSLPLEPARRAMLEEALKTRNYNLAETVLAEEIERDPKSTSLLAFLGGIFFLDGKYLNSAIAFKKAEAISPVEDRNRFTLAMDYVILNHRDWARPELEKLAKSDPHNALYPYWLSRLDYDAMQFTSAVAHAREALALDPSFMKAYDNLGLCYEALGKYDEAIQAYQEGIRLNRAKPPGSPWPPLNLGALLIKLNRVEEAGPYLKESLRIDPRFPQAHYQLGLLLERQDRFDQAIQELRQAAVVNPSFAEPHYALGRIYRRKGNAKDADTEWAIFSKLKKQEDSEPRPH